MTALTGFDGHQGIALVVAPRRYASVADILARAIERGEPPFVLVLDSLEDPQNVGTLLRSAEAAGAHGVIFPTRRQAPLSPAAVKASAGAVEHLLLAPVDDLAGALADLHVAGPAGRRRRSRGAARRSARPTCAVRSPWSSAARARASGPAVRAPLRPDGPDPDARRDRLAQRLGRRLDPALRGDDPARPPRSEAPPKAKAPAAAGGCARPSPGPASLWRSPKFRSDARGRGDARARRAAGRAPSSGEAPPGRSRPRRSPKAGPPSPRQAADSREGDAKAAKADGEAGKAAAKAAAEAKAAEGEPRRHARPRPSPRRHRSVGRAAALSWAAPGSSLSSHG